MVAPGSQWIAAVHEACTSATVHLAAAYQRGTAHAIVHPNNQTGLPMLQVADYAQALRSLRHPTLLDWKLTYSACPCPCPRQSSSCGMKRRPGPGPGEQQHAAIQTETTLWVRACRYSLPVGKAMRPRCTWHGSCLLHADAAAAQPLRPCPLAIPYPASPSSPSRSHLRSRHCMCRRRQGKAKACKASTNDRLRSQGPHRAAACAAKTIMPEPVRSHSGCFIAYVQGGSAAHNANPTAFPCSALAMLLSGYEEADQPGYAQPPSPQQKRERTPRHAARHGQALQPALLPCLSHIAQNNQHSTCTHTTCSNRGHSPLTSLHVITREKGNHTRLAAQRALARGSISAPVGAGPSAVTPITWHLLTAKKRQAKAGHHEGPHAWAVGVNLSPGPPDRSATAA